MRLLDRLLERPGFYDVVQRVASLGGNRQVADLFERFVNAPGYDEILELGCGTGLWTPSRYRRLVRSDVNAAYFPSVPSPGVEYRVMNAADFTPLADERFDLVYSMGLYHHLSDEEVVSSLRSSASALHEGGRIVLFDAAMPASVLRVHAWVCRKLDRGGHVRDEEHTRSLVRGAGLVIRSSQRCGWGPGFEGLFLEISG